MLLVSQKVKDLQQQISEQERVKKEGDQHNFQLSVFQLSAMVLVHLTVDLLQFLQWCASLLESRRMSRAIAQG